MREFTVLLYEGQDALWRQLISIESSEESTTGIEFDSKSVPRVLLFLEPAH